MKKKKSADSSAKTDTPAPATHGAPRGQSLRGRFEAIPPALAPEHVPAAQSIGELQETLGAVEMQGKVLQREHDLGEATVRELAGTRILIVEDSPVQAELLRSTLEDHGIVVSVAVNGEEGLAKAREVSPALIISDVMMPVMNGYELCRQVKQDKALADIPVVLLTTLSDPADIVHGINAGADYYLTKPCDGDYLMYRLSTIFAAAKAPEASRAKVTTPVRVGGQDYEVSASPRQLLDLMISTYENSVNQNRELQRQKADLQSVNSRLEELATERTTELRQQEKLLAETERITQTGSWEWDIPSNRFLFSREWQRIHGISRDSMTTEEFLSILHPDDMPKGKLALEESVATRRPYNLETRIVRQDTTEERLTGSRGQLVLDEAGTPLKMYGTTHDITIQRRTEDERRELEMQLRQAQKLESIGTLASGVAHEINNPINGILNYADLIQEVLPADSPEAEYCQEIMHESERVATIVRNLLAFSRNERQTHSPALMKDVIDATLSLVRTVIRHDQVELTVDVPENLPALKCRSQQIQQVLMNLLTNARDALNVRYPGYDPNKIISITVRQFQHHGREWLRTTVEDHGCGIPKTLRDQIFDPFFTTKDRAKGTGLGLAISHGIVSDHHGSLSVESEINQFTRFHLDLPVDNGWELEG